MAAREATATGSRAPQRESCPHAQQLERGFLKENFFLIFKFKIFELKKNCKPYVKKRKKKTLKLCSYSKQAEDYTETTEMGIVFS